MKQRFAGLVAGFFATVVLAISSGVDAQITDRLNGVQAGLALKAPVRTVTNGPITLAGEQTVNGVAVVEGDRVLVKDQADATANGIYNVDTTAWDRAADFDGNRDVTGGTLVTVYNDIADGVFYQVVADDPVIIGTSAITFDARDDPAVTYDQTPAELSNGVIPANYAYPPGNIYRYGAIVNSSGAAAANDDAFDDALIANAKTIVPEGTFWVSNAVVVPAQDKTIEGANQFTSIVRLASGAANSTNVVELSQFTTIRNLWIRGNWGGVTAGQLGSCIYGNGINAGGPGINYIHGTDLDRVQLTHCKSYGYHEVDGAYARLYYVLSDTHGLDAVYLEGSSTGQSTTYTIGGKSVFSGTPNGYGLHIKNLFVSDFNGIISEHTKGVLIEGANSNITFRDWYFENIVAATPYIFHFPTTGPDAASAFNVKIADNYLGFVATTAVVQGNENVLGVEENNRNFTGQPWADDYEANWWPKGVASTRSSQFTTVGNVGTGEDTIYTYTLPAKALLADGDAVRITVYGKTAANVNNKTLKLKFGGTTIYNSGAVAANDRDWKLVADVVRSASSFQRSAVTGVYNNALISVSSTAPNENPTLDIVISVTGEATTTNDITGIGFQVEFLDYVPTGALFDLPSLLERAVANDDRYELAA